MVIDDDDDDRKLFCWTLKRITENIGCLRASNGQDALEYLNDANNTVPDLIFLDINMPVMTGWQFLTKIKRNEQYKDIPVIIFSTSSHRRDINIAFDLGAQSYCVKPDEPEDLRSMLSLIVKHIDNNLQAFLSSGVSRYFHLPTV